MTSPSQCTPDLGSDQPPESAYGDRWLFIIEGVDPGDALLRLLGIVAVQQARVRKLDFSGAGGRFQARLEVEGLAAKRAEHLRHRLAQLPIALAVSVGSLSLRPSSPR